MANTAKTDSAAIREYFERWYARPDPWKYEGSVEDVVRTRAVLRSMRHARFEYGLDLGCGEGRLTNEFAEQAKRMLGVDIAAAAIERASKRFPTIEFRQGDMVEFLAEPAQRSRPFDFVSVAECLYYYPDDQTRIRALDLLTGIGTPTCLYFFSSIVQQGTAQRRYFQFDELVGLLDDRFTIINCFPSVARRPRWVDWGLRAIPSHSARIAMLDLYTVTRVPRDCRAVGILALKKRSPPTVTVTTNRLPG